MFVETVYLNRRNILKHNVGSGIILINGNREVPMNYKSNTYSFIQDSTFLYYCGIQRAGLDLIIDVENDQTYLVGNDYNNNDIIWIGEQETLKDLAAKSLISEVISTKAMIEMLQERKGEIHYLPPYRCANEKLILEITKDQELKPSQKLILSVIHQRSIKEDREVVEMERAINITRDIHVEIMKKANEGVSEHELLGSAFEIAKSNQSFFGYNPIITTQGQVLHMTTYNNTLKKGQFLLADVGVTTHMGYAADITRTTPVNRQFDGQQRDMFGIVLRALQQSIESCAVGKKFRDIHLNAARIITEGLIDLGVMKGNAEEAVRAGAHALFFPHGLGHHIGLDVHDMENLGEDLVGYGKEVERSEQFGLAFLRNAKQLQENHVVTVEPGLYFIPKLIEQWSSERKHSDFIQYNVLDTWKNKGGVRLEDNVLITKKGREILGMPIPKTIEELENLT